MYEGTSTVKVVKQYCRKQAFQIQLHSNNRNPKAAISQKPLHQGQKRTATTRKIQNISTSAKAKTQQHCKNTKDNNAVLKQSVNTVTDTVTKQVQSSTRTIAASQNRTTHVEKRKLCALYLYTYYNILPNILLKTGCTKCGNQHKSPVSW